MKAGASDIINDTNIGWVYLLFSLMFGIAFIFGSIMRKFKISVSIGYLFAGMILGLFIRVPRDVSDLLFFFSEISILLLFFEIGFEIHIDNIDKISGFPLYITALQLFLALSMSIGVLSLFDLSLNEVIIYGLMAAFSSTVFTYKLVEDAAPTRDDVKDTVLMVLAVQDIAIVIALSLIIGYTGSLLLRLIYVISSIVALTVLSLEFVKYVLNRVITIDDNGLILLLSYGLFLGVIASFLGFSTALGGFIAGLTASHVHDSDKLIKMMKPIRFVFLTLFLISMGLNMFIHPLNITEYITAFIIGVIITIIHIIVTMVSAVVAGGLGVKYGFEAGFYLSTISELTLVIAYYASLYGYVSSISALVSSTGIILGSLIASWLIFRKDYFIPKILNTLSYNRVAYLDELILGTRGIIRSKYTRIGRLFKKFIHGLGELLIITIVVGTSIKYIIEYVPINSFIIILAIISVYIFVFIRLYIRSRDTLNDLLLTFEKFREKSLLVKIIDRIYTSLVLVLSLMTVFIILYIEYKDILLYIDNYINTTMLVFTALFIIPLIELLLIFYEIKVIGKKGE